MIELLSPDKIYEDFLNNMLNKSENTNPLISLVENGYDGWQKLLK